MALQVWLPFNKNEIKNQGYENPAITIAGTQTYADGKLGKCLTLQGSNSIYVKIPYTNIGTEISVCCWVKANSPGNWSDIFSFGNNNRVEKSTSTQYNYYADSNPLITSGTALFTMNNAVWTHITMTADGTDVKFYINGILFKTYSQVNTLSTVFKSNKFFVIGMRTNLNLAYKGYMNDFRIYDHALSPKEVKDISKGLILHYPLDELCINDNSSLPLPLKVPSGQSLYDTTIYTESDGSKWLRIFHHNNPAGSLFSSSNNFEDYVHIDANRWFDISYCHWLYSWEFIVKLKTTSSASEVKYRWIQTKSPLTSTYNDVKPSSVTRITTSGYTNGGFGGLYILNNNTRMCIANASNGNWYGALGCWKAYNGGIPGYPNTTVTSGYIDLYIRIDSLLNPIAYDSSGYCNHGSIIGTLSAGTSTPRYTASAVFNGGNNHIVSPSIKKEGFKNSFTVSWWSKTSNMSGKMAWGSSNNGLNLYPSGSYFCWNTGDGATNTIGTVAWATYNDGNWHHYVMTGDGTTGKLYIDGEHKGNAKTYKPLSSPIIYVSGWNANSNYVWNGNISDFRIYCTALSENDVKELYNTSAFVTDNGVFAEYELYEDNLSDVKKTGLLETANFYENGAESGYTLDTDKTRVANNYIISEEFIEI